MNRDSRKTALVTGASRGIGRAVAAQLANDGLRVCVHFHKDVRAAESTLEGLEGEGHVLLAADLSLAESAAGLAEDATEKLGGHIDVLVHSAGQYSPTPLSERGDFAHWQESFRQQMQLNFLAGADLAYLLVRGMAAAGWGRIIQIASRSGLRGEARYSAYSASKAAQINFIKSLALELAPVGVGCFAIAPGWVATDMSAEVLATEGADIRASIPVGRVAKPEDIAGLVSYLVNPAADYLTGNTIDVNGASYLR